MNIFDYIKSILFNKNKLLLSDDDLNQYNYYMLNRWISFYSPEINNFVNETTNMYNSLFTTKEQQYDYMINFLPKLKYKKINYIKKEKYDNNDEKVVIPEFISRKQYKQDLLLNYESRIS